MNVNAKRKLDMDKYYRELDQVVANNHMSDQDIYNTRTIRKMTTPLLSQIIIAVVVIVFGLFLTMDISKFQ